MKYDVREALANNVKKLMEGTKNGTPDLSTQAKLAVRCRLAQRTIGYVITPDPNGKNQPTLKTIAAIADAFKVDSWQLLHPTMGEKVKQPPELLQRFEMADDRDRHIIRRILNMEDVGASDETVAKHLKPAPSVKSRSRHNG